MFLFKPIKSGVELFIVLYASPFSQNLEGSDALKKKKKNPYFFVTTEPIWMGSFSEMQIMSLKI